MTQKIRPMLAGKAPDDLDKLRFPILVSPKLDGIRCLIKDGKAVSRTLKPIRNRFVQQILGTPVLNGVDGELVVGDPTASNCMQMTNSGIMSFDGEPDFTFYAFDIWSRGNLPFANAFDTLVLRGYNYGRLKVLDQDELQSVSQLEAYEEDVLSAGYEGVILRDPNAPYKFNRSTTREQWLLKLKRFAQDDAVIVGVRELTHNENSPIIDARGYTERSHAQSGKIEGNTLGSFICHLLKPSGSLEYRSVMDDETGLLTLKPIQFKVSAGSIPHPEKLRLWQIRDGLIGKTITFKHFKQTGVKDLPRGAQFVSFRDKEDIG